LKIRFRSLHAIEGIEKLYLTALIAPLQITEFPTAKGMDKLHVRAPIFKRWRRNHGQTNCLQAA
jgi:hypothetical protein